MQLVYLGKLSRPKYHEFSRKLLIFSMLQYSYIKCKNATILCYLPIIQITVYKRTIARFSADKVVSEMGDATGFRQHKSTLSFEAHELDSTVNYTAWANLTGECQFHAKSHELTGAFLACPPDRAQGPLPLRPGRGLPLPGWRAIVPVVWILFSRLLMLPRFQPSSGNSLNSLRATHLDRQRFLKSESHLPEYFSRFYLMFTDIEVSTVSQGNVDALNKWGRNGL